MSTEVANAEVATGRADGREDHRADGRAGDRAGDRADGPGLIVTAGGAPDAAQMAALVVALTPGSAPPVAGSIPAWRRAALLEAVGGAATLSPGDLELAAARGRHV